MKSTLSIACTVFFALLGVCRVGLSEPITLGYERWTQTSNISGAVFQQPPEWYYGIHADKLMIGSFPDSKPRAPNRLIDIEVNRNAQSEIVMDGLWVENKGDFEADSWLLHGLTPSDINVLELLDEFYFLDLEAYESAHGVPTEYAAIVKRNTHKFDTEILRQATLETINDRLRNGWRPIDIDVLHNDGFEPTDHLAWNIVLFNAILVKNTGANFKATHFSVQTYDQYQSLDEVNSAGIQAIDVEPLKRCVTIVIECPEEDVVIRCEDVCNSDASYATVYVYNGSPFELIENVAAPSFIDLFDDLSDRYMRSVDIESTRSSDLSSPANLHSVFLH